MIAKCRPNFLVRNSIDTTDGALEQSDADEFVHPSWSTHKNRSTINTVPTRRGLWRDFCRSPLRVGWGSAVTTSLFCKPVVMEVQSELVSIVVLGTTSTASLTWCNYLSYCDLYLPYFGIVCDFITWPISGSCGPAALHECPPQNSRHFSWFHTLGWCKTNRTNILGNRS